MWREAAVREGSANTQKLQRWQYALDQGRRPPKRTRVCSCTDPAQARAALTQSAGHDLACFVSQSSVRLMLFCDLQEMLYTHTSRSRIPCRTHISP